MPRIRTIKPEFWSSPLVRKTGLRYVSTAAILDAPRQWWPSLPGHIHGDGFLYFFIGKDESVLYVGKTTAPRIRIPQHRRKEWWEKAKEIEVAAFDCDDLKLANRTLHYLEVLAISMFDPTENIAMPSAEALEVARSAMV